MSIPQLSVFQFSGAYIVGEATNDSPAKALPYLIDATSTASQNVIGTAFTIVAGSTGIPAPATVKSGGTGVFAGILVNPKAYALYGTTGNPLAATITLPNGVTAEFATIGSWAVNLPATANVGDWVIFNNTTGVLSTVSPGTALPSGYTAVNAYVDQFNVPSGGGIGSITFAQLNAIPVPASEALSVSKSAKGAN